MNFGSFLLRIPASRLVLATAALAALMGARGHAAERVLEISITEALSVPERLAAYRWNFIKAETAQGQPLDEIRQPEDWPVTLEMGFADAGHRGMSVCNSINWKYTLTGESGIRFDNFHSTLKGCGRADGKVPSEGNDVMSLEQRVKARLPQVRSFTLSLAKGSTPPLLTLSFEDGSRWNFDGTPTERTKYGDDRTQVVIEVEAARQRCAKQGPESRQECIRVREVRWDEPDRTDPMKNANMKELSLGIKEMFKGEIDWKSAHDFSYAGPWQLLRADAIDYFKPAEGSHTLEYANKYRLHKQPSGMPDFAYTHVGRMFPRSTP
ncbi:META domain-containing protein [Diaphorobacter caeni]|uniref:META domain-containing protein n=1 Tax=Diaphorobacter caeni TaxID=2784387 RepID=UPI00188DC9AB|nr:META domain-containing protein [Diaphorobacter caeni]MBF5004245.1 META domain-containing protein [Diaphorobacter caeni]